MQHSIQRSRHLKVWKPVPRDRDAVLSLFRDFHGESWYRDYDFSEDKFNVLWNAIMTSPEYFMVIATDNDVPVGYMAGMMAEHFFGHDRMAIDLGLYIKPEYRGDPKVPRDMIECFHCWATDCGAKEMIVGATSGIKEGSIVRFYERLGFEQQANAMRKRCIA